MTADSRLVGNVTDIPAVGWKHDFRQVSGTLHLPPGWRLLHASGVDEVPSTWVREWSLLQIFLGLILAIAIGRLHGWRWGGIALVMLALTLPEDGAPRWSWIFVLVGEALVRVLPAGIFLRIAKMFRGAMLVLVALLAIPFMVRHVREGMYPVLAGESVNVGSGETLASGLDIGRRVRQQGGRHGNPRQGRRGLDGQSRRSRPPRRRTRRTRHPRRRARGGRGRGQSREKASASVTTMPAPTSTTRRVRPRCARKGREQQAQFNTETYDPNAVVQTGPGSAALDVVEHSADLERPRRRRPSASTCGSCRPSVNFALAFVRFLLLAIVLLRMIPYTARFWPKGWGPVVKVGACGALARARARRRARPPPTCPTRPSSTS